MKAFKRHSAAVKAANGRPIIRVGDLHIVGDITSTTEISVQLHDGPVVGFVNAGHLERLGNANHAVTVQHTGYWYDGDAFAFDHRFELEHEAKHDRDRLARKHENHRRMVRMKEYKPQTF